ncbi:MAG: hypothetical protein ACLQVD_10565 [Capsulimonadaceae bacterium]
MPVPSFPCDIADDVRDGRPRRMKVRTLMAHYGLKRRRAQGLTAIRADLRELGLESVPEFESADFDDRVRFVLAGDGDDGAVDEAEGSEAGIYRRLGVTAA